MADIKKAVVTGATGFIGRNLINELIKQGVEVIGVCRNERFYNDNAPDYRLVCCEGSRYEDLTDIIRDQDIDVIFHMAWQGVSDEQALDVDVQLENILSTCKLVDVAHNMGIPAFVGAGSMYEPEALVENASQQPLRDLKMASKASKTAAHWMAKARAGYYGIRFFWPYINTYGEGERSGRLLGTLIRSMLRGEQPALSKGEQYYDFLHIEDVARAMILIARSGVDGRDYVLGSGDAKPLKYFLSEVGNIVNEMSGQNIKLEFGQRDSKVTYIPQEFFSIDNLCADTGFKPQIPFAEGVRRTVAYYMREITE